MSFNIDKINFDIFLSLLQDPLQSERSISRLTGISLPTVKDRLFELKQKNFLRSDKVIYDPVLGERKQTEVEASYVPKAIGLEKIYVLFTNIVSISQMGKLISIIGSHPYCHYQTQCPGNTGVIFSSFHIPAGTSSTVDSFCKEISNENKCNYIFLKDMDFEAESFMDFSKWDIFKQIWTLQSKNYDTLSSISGHNPETNVLEQTILAFADGDKFSNPNNVILREQQEIQNYQTNSNFDLNSASLLDMSLIRELTLNGKVTVQFLSEEYNVDRSTVYRHLNNLNKFVIDDYLLQYNNSYFDLTINLLIFGYFKPNSEIKFSLFNNFFNQGFFPFQSTLVSDQKTFLWQIATTPFFLTEITDFCWKHFNNQFFFLINPKTSFKYFFASNNFLPEKLWRQDKEFLLGKVN